MNYKKMKENVIKDKHYQKWVHGIGEGTTRQYLYSLTTFCLVTGKTPSELLEICKKDYHKPPWERSIGNWFIEFDQYCADRNYSKETFRRKVTNVRGFFRFNQIETPSSRRGKKERFRRANDRQLPTREEIILLLNACKYIKEKAIILTQFSSGLGNSDVVKLTVDQFWDGLDDNDICQLRLRRHKNENEFITFLSPEAVKAIKSYLRVERDNIKASQPLFTKVRTSDEPLHTVAIIHTYARLCDGLEWDKEGNTFRKITGHMGRKWLKTNLANAGMPREPLETLLGHRLRTGTDDNYYIMHEDQLKSIYIKYLPYIAIEQFEKITIESVEFKEMKKYYEQDAEAKNKEIELLKEEIQLIKKLVEDYIPNESK